MDPPKQAVKRKSKASGGKRGTKKPRVEGKPASRLKKERRSVRKGRKEGYSLTTQAKTVWERLRRHNLKRGDRSSLVAEQMAIITGHIREMTLKHDTARVVQCCLKYGSPEHRTTIFKELKDSVVELSKLSYANFTVKSMMKYGSPLQRNQLISSLYGHVQKLARHSKAAEVLEMAYNNYANAQQRRALIQEFYGPEFALFKSPECQTLAQVLSANPGKKSTVIKHMKNALLSLLHKDVVKHSIVHTALLEFLQYCDEESQAEMIEALREVVVGILHTKEGSRVALHCLWHGTPKDRKAIVKSFKTYVKKICMEENGYIVMLAVFDTVDDTALVKKALLRELCGSLEELCDNQYGRKVVLYLLKPRSPQHFSSQFLHILTPGDGNKHTKKPAEVRYRELLESVSEPLLELAGQKVCEWAQSKPHAPLLVQMAESLEGDLCVLYRPLVELLSEEFDPTAHLAVDPSGHQVVRRLISADSKREHSPGVHFAELLLEGVSPSNIQAWATTNRGAFIVCSLVESKVEGVGERVRKILEPVVEDWLRTASLKGQEALYRLYMQHTT